MRHYQTLYEKYLEPMIYRSDQRAATSRDESLRLLEVGLGCDMHNGPGKLLQVCQCLSLWTRSSTGFWLDWTTLRVLLFSTNPSDGSTADFQCVPPQLWTAYLPDSDISFVEPDAACATKYISSIEARDKGRLYIGDQANMTFLQEIVDAQAGKLFDVIISDGGHRMLQQKAILEHLWQLIAPGGIFMVEDLLTPYHSAYDSGHKGLSDSMIEILKDTLDGLHCEFWTDCTPVLPGLLGMDCFKEACVLTKT